MRSIYSDFGNAKCSWSTCVPTWKKYYSVPKVGLSRYYVPCIDTPRVGLVLVGRANSFGVMARQSLLPVCPSVSTQTWKLPIHISFSPIWMGIRSCMGLFLSSYPWTVPNCGVPEHRKCQFLYGHPDLATIHKQAPFSTRSWKVRRCNTWMGPVYSWIGITHS
jgi:hypothetical protein